MSLSLQIKNKSTPSRRLFWCLFVINYLFGTCFICIQRDLNAGLSWYLGHGPFTCIWMVQHSRHGLLIQHKYMLCILTSKQVLRMPFAGQNYFLGAKTYRQSLVDYYAPTQCISNKPFWPEFVQKRRRENLRLWFTL